MSRGSASVLLAGWLIFGMSAGCVSSRPSSSFDVSPYAEKPTAIYHFGVSIPVGGDLTDGADARVGGSLTGSYMFSEFFSGIYWGIQGSFAGMSATEEISDQVFGGQFGDFRQETSLFALTVGPRFSLPIPLSEDLEKGPILEPYVEAGFGGYFTRIYAAFPRGDSRSSLPGAPDTETSETDVAHDFGLNGGGGLLLRLSEAVYVGGGVRIDIGLFRPEKEERFMAKGGPSIEEAVFSDSGGGRSDELVFVTIGATFAFRF